MINWKVDKRNEIEYCPFCYSKVSVPDGKTFFNCPECKETIFVKLFDSSKYISYGSVEYEAGSLEVSVINVDEKAESVGIVPYFEVRDYIYTVTSINSSAISGKKFLEKIMLPNTIKTIGEFAFYSCSELRNITLPDDLELLGPHTFEDCTNLRGITVGNKLRKIKEEAFRDCNKLTKIRINGCDKEPENGEAILPDSIEAIREDCFEGTGIKKVSVPEDVEIDDTTVEFIERKEKLFVKSFVDDEDDEDYDDEGDEEISSSENSTALRETTTSNDTHVDGIVSTCPYCDSSLILDDYGFCKNCKKQVIKNYNEVSPPSNIKFSPNIDLHFNGRSFEVVSIEVPEGNAVVIPSYLSFGGKKYVVSSIAPNAALNNSKMEHLIIPSTITSIGNGAFSGCSYLKQLTICGKGLSEIGGSAFENCSRIEMIVVSGKWDEANPGLITLPDSVVKVGPNCFRGSSIKRVSVSDRADFQDNSVNYEPRKSAAPVVSPKESVDPVIESIAPKSSNSGKGRGLWDKILKSRRPSA